MTQVRCSTAALWVLIAAGCGGPRSIDTILADLQQAEGASRQRFAAELNKHGAAAVDAWITLLQRKDYGLYVIAAGELGALGAAAAPAVPALAGYLRDGFPGMQQDAEMSTFDRIAHPDIGRSPARKALARIGAPALVAVRALLAHPVGQTRQEATFTLGQIGKPAAAAVPELVQRLTDSDKAVAAAAAWSIGEIGAFDAVVAKSLQNAVLDDHQLVRFEVLKAIGKLAPHTRDLRPLVEKMLEDADSGVRQMAREVLDRLPAAAPGSAGSGRSSSGK